MHEEQQSAMCSVAETHVLHCSRRKDNTFYMDAVRITCLIAQMPSPEEVPGEGWEAAADSDGQGSEASTDSLSLSEGQGSEASPESLPL